MQAIHVKVWDEKQEKVVFDGKVSTIVEPRHLLRFIHECAGECEVFFFKGSNRELKSFKGLLKNKIELLAMRGSTTYFRGVMSVGRDGVLRTSETIPPREAGCLSMFILQNKMSEEDCMKVFQCDTLEELKLFCFLVFLPRDISKLTKLRKLSIECGA